MNSISDKKIITSAVAFVIGGSALCFLAPYFLYSIFGESEKPSILQLSLTAGLIALLSVFVINVFQKQLNLDKKWKNMVLFYMFTVILSQMVILLLFYYSSVTVMGLFSMNPNDEWSWITNGTMYLVLNMVVLLLANKASRNSDNKIFSSMGKIKYLRILSFISIAVFLSYLIAIAEVPIYALILGPFFMPLQLLINAPLGAILVILGLVLSMYLLYRVCKMTIVKVNGDKNLHASAAVVCCFMAFAFAILCTITILTMSSIWKFDA